MAMQSREDHPLLFVADVKLKTIYSPFTFSRLCGFELFQDNLDRNNENILHRFGNPQKTNLVEIAFLNDY
jgi:hypothetical protein